jgi:hypothetical protein
MSGGRSREATNFRGTNIRLTSLRDSALARQDCLARRRNSHLQACQSAATESSRPARCGRSRVSANSLVAADTIQYGHFPFTMRSTMRKQLSKLCTGGRSLVISRNSFRLRGWPISHEWTFIQVELA